MATVMFQPREHCRCSSPACPDRSMPVDLGPNGLGYGAAWGSVGYPSASSMSFHGPAYRHVMPQAPPRPIEPRVKVILPAQVQEQIDAEREARRIARAWAGLGPTSRPLTDDECIEAWGETHQGLRESAEYWRERLDELGWWRRRARSEARDQLKRATIVHLAAQAARKPTDPPTIPTRSSVAT